MGRSCVFSSCHLPLWFLFCLLLFYGSEKTIPNMLFCFLLRSFYLMGSRVLSAGPCLPGLLRRGEKVEEKEFKAKVALVRVSEWIRKGFVRLFQTLFEWDLLVVGRKNCCFLLPFSLRLLRCAMNKDIPADLKLCFSCGLSSPFPNSTGAHLTVSTCLSLVIHRRLH